MAFISISIQTHLFSIAEEEALLRAQQTDCGALIAFQGMVRGNDHQKALSHLYLEHYPLVTEQEIQRIIQFATERWPITACRVIHRVGNLPVGEPVVLVIVMATHRKEAFKAAEYVMDFLKTEAPFWKKACFVDGSEQWVAAKTSDAAAKAQWDE